MIVTFCCQTTERNHVHIVGLSLFQCLNVLNKASVNPLETDDDAGGVQSGAIVEEATQDGRSRRGNGKPLHQLLQ